jgi:hypothetical protein
MAGSPKASTHQTSKTPKRCSTNSGAPDGRKAVVEIVAGFDGFRRVHSERSLRKNERQVSGPRGGRPVSAAYGASCARIFVGAEAEKADHDLPAHSGNVGSSRDGRKPEGERA